ncbi:MAG: vWA domain-containing protein [Cytophagaceae bacterium]
MPEFSKEMFYWFSLHWFDPRVVQEYTWENIYYLYMIPLMPSLLLIRWILHFRSRTKLDIALRPQDLQGWDLIGAIRFIPYGLKMLCIFFVLIALARPQKINETIEQSSEGIDIMLVLDISESMQLEDFKPNRLEAAKEVARNFIKGRQHDRIGIVVFSGEAYSLSPLSMDYKLLNDFINGIQFDMIESGGTAIGSALAIGINRMRDSDSRSKVMILLSDGENTAGNIDPVLTSELAHAYGIKIYTIGVGSDGAIPHGKDEKGNPQYVQSMLDENTLRTIADKAEGKFFRASGNHALSEVFLFIDKQEKGKIRESRFRDNKDYYEVYLAWAVFFLLCWLITKSTFLSNAMED